MEANKRWEASNRETYEGAMLYHNANSLEGKMVSLPLSSFRRSVSGIVMVLLLALAVPTTALAGGSVNCSHYGRLYTFGNSTSSQYHTVQGLGTTGNLGSGYESYYWGYHSGWKNWDVYGAGVTSENASCIPT